jgi:hypothetical protein
MAEPVPTELYYRFPCSSLLVTGTCEQRKDWDTGKEVVRPTADISLFVEADTRRPMVRLPQQEGAHEQSLKLTPDGRLASVSGSAHGLLAMVIETSLAVTSFAAGLIGAAIAPRLPGLPTVAAASPSIATRTLAGGPKGDAESPAKKWADENPDGDATRLANARSALAALHDELIAHAQESADQQPASAYRRLVAIKHAISLVEEEVAAINLRKDAWFNTRFSTIEQHRFQLPTDRAFRLAGDHSVAPVKIALSDLEPGSAAATAALERLYVAVVEVRTAVTAQGATIDDAADLDELERDEYFGALGPGMYFRVPRPAVIAIYQDAADRKTDDASRELTLHSVDRYWVVDRDSRMGSVPLVDEGKASVSFGSTGAVDSVALDIESRLEKVLEALKGAPAAISGGLTQAKGTVEAWNSLRAARADRELRVLEQRKQQLESEIANRGLEADAEQTETLQELKDRLERLKVEKDIAGIQAPGQSDEEREATARRDLAARLRTEVAIAKAEHELAGFHDDSTSNGHS